MGKRILIITYYWPPSGGAGVQRWLKFVKYLRRAGWEPVIYTPENPEYPSIDESMIDEVPNGIEVIKTKIWEPFNLYKKVASKNKDEKINAGFLTEEGQKSKWIQNFAIWVRGNFFIPDARKFWIKPSIKYLKDYIESNPVDAIISTGPPHSMHLIAKGLKKKFNLPWIADFRDPWTNIDFYDELKLTKLADKKHHRLEKQVLQSADICLTIGETMKTEFEDLGAKRVEVITNGYDATDLPTTKPAKDSKKSIAHIGTLNPARNPTLLWQALRELLKEYPGWRDGLQIKLVGKVDINVKKDIEKAGLSDLLYLIPYLKHEEAIAEQMKSHLLLLMVNNTPNAKGILTGKMFEYMSSGTPILGIGPGDGDAAKILNETQSGQMIDYEDLESLKTYLKKFMADEIKTSASAIDKYSRASLTNDLVGLLEEIRQ